MILMKTNTTGSDNDLVLLPGTRPLSESMLINIINALFYHQEAMSWMHNAQWSSWYSNKEI